MQPSVCSRCHGQALPPCWARSTIGFERLRDPPPQVLVHGVQRPQPCSTQSIGQFSTLQTRDWMVDGQALPPLAVPDTICLVRCWLPLPQVLVHEVQPDQAVVWQSTGQRNMLHGSDSDLWPQATPPKYASTETERERLREPPAQDLVHLDQADHAIILQSIGQFVVLHTCDTEVGPQAVPPFLAWRTTFLVRVCTPPPQVTEQSPQAFHVSARMQLSGHAWVLQACSSACGPQAAPNLLAGVITSRVRACLPPSQVLVHVVQLGKGAVDGAHREALAAHGLDERRGALGAAEEGLARALAGAGLGGVTAGVGARAELGPR